VTGPTIRCHYATDPAARPHCQLQATIRYGHINLCDSCQQQRSTLGKGQHPTPLPPSEPIDLLDWIDQAHRDLHAAQRILAPAVHRARQHGHPWSAIGTTLGITRQAAQQRFPPADGAKSNRHSGANSD
jgi:hypothetical protein